MPKRHRGELETHPTWLNAWRTFRISQAPIVYHRCPRTSNRDKTVTQEALRHQPIRDRGRTGWVVDRVHVVTVATSTTRAESVTRLQSGTPSITSSPLRYRVFVVDICSKMVPARGASYTAYCRRVTHTIRIRRRLYHNSHILGNPRDSVLVCCSVVRPRLPTADVRT